MQFQAVTYGARNNEAKIKTLAEECDVAKSIISTLPIPEDPEQKSVVNEMLAVYVAKKTAAIGRLEKEKRSCIKESIATYKNLQRGLLDALLHSKYTTVLTRQLLKEGFTVNYTNFDEGSQTIDIQIRKDDYVMYLSSSKLLDVTAKPSKCDITLKAILDSVCPDGVID
ncbi:MAG: hypothetical protein DDT42_02020 [candidate division WS2 bacterium]|uniref:Uncharacterized protein n=1 Tax=Psychracetigena formicireducens TaxID=2986056 RepID=A0A9E2BID0_PSYF1|nr:hypothetical protein [Candidatus Psychracetigena formicireducens]